MKRHFIILRTENAQSIIAGKQILVQKNCLTPISPPPSKNNTPSAILDHPS